MPSVITPSQKWGVVYQLPLVPKSYHTRRYRYGHALLLPHTQIMSNPVSTL